MASEVPRLEQDISQLQARYNYLKRDKIDLCGADKRLFDNVLMKFKTELVNLLGTFSGQSVANSASKIKCGSVTENPFGRSCLNPE